MKVSEQLQAALIKVAAAQPLEKQAGPMAALLRTIPGMLRNPGVVRTGLKGLQGLGNFGSKMLGGLTRVFRGGAMAAPEIAGAEAAGMNAVRNVGLPAIADPWAAAHSTAHTVPGAVGPGMLGQGSNWKFWGDAAKPSAAQMARGARPGSGWNPLKQFYGARHYADDLSVPQRFGKFLGTGAKWGGGASLVMAPQMAQNAGELGAARALAEMKGKMEEGNPWDRFWRAMGYAYAPDEQWVNNISRSNPNVARAYQYLRTSKGDPSALSTAYAVLTGSYL